MVTVRMNAVLAQVFYTKQSPRGLFLTATLGDGGLLLFQKR